MDQKLLLMNLASCAMEEPFASAVSSASAARIPSMTPSIPSRRVAWADFQSTCFLLSQTYPLARGPSVDSPNRALLDEIWTRYDIGKVPDDTVVNPPPIDIMCYCRVLVDMWPMCQNACLVQVTSAIPEQSVYDNGKLGKTAMSLDTCRKWILLWYPVALDDVRTALYMGLLFALLHSFDYIAQHITTMRSDLLVLWNELYALLQQHCRERPLVSSQFASLYLSDVPTDMLTEATRLPNALVANIVLAYDVAHSPQTVLHRVQRDFCI